MICKEIHIERSSSIEVETTILKATDKGIVIEYPYSEAQFLVGSLDECKSEILRELTIGVWDTISVTVHAINSLGCAEELVETHKYDYSWSNIVSLMASCAKLSKEAYDNVPNGIDSSDEDTYEFTRDGVVQWFVNQYIILHAVKLERGSMLLAKRAKIKDKECPVLMTPLVLGETVELRKCGHMLSKQAFVKMMTEGRVSATVKCPLCREEHHECQTTLIQ
jgi:hypothetical protein